MEKLDLVGVWVKSVSFSPPPMVKEFAFQRSDSKVYRGGKRRTFWTFSVYMTPKNFFEKKCIFWTFWTFRHLFYEKFRDKSSNFELFMLITRGKKFLTKKCIFENFELLGTFFIRKSSKSSNFELFELFWFAENFG